MKRNAWKVLDLVLLVLSTGMAFGALRYFWQPAPHPNTILYLSGYLVLLAMATLGAFLGRPVARRPCQGYAAYGWLNLVCLLKCGFGITTIYDAEAVVEGSQMGIAFGAVCAVAAVWFLEPPRDAEAPPEKISGSDRRRDSDAPRPDLV